MNPRAALTTYSLSRGAPSASLGTSPNCPRFVIFQNNSFRILMLFIQFLSSSPKNLVHYIALSICLSSTFLVFSKTFFQQPDERREWDSNPRALADKRFSRPPRYDHFDISPYVVVCVRCVLTADASDILALKYSPVNNFFTFFSFFISSFCFSLQNPHKYGICRDPVFLKTL